MYSKLNHTMIDTGDHFRLARMLVRILGLVMLLLLNHASFAGNDKKEIVPFGLMNYAQTYPDIYFLHLRSWDMWALKALPTLIGKNAINRDYAHGQSVRELLVDAQMERIKLMLATGEPSATLFATSSDAVVKKPYVCVLTLDDQKLLQDSFAATKFMLSGDQQAQPAQVSTSAKIDGASFLRFTLDHEVYHCLDAYLNGPPRPQTTSNLTAGYHDFRVEYSADMFASLNARRQGNGSRDFLNTMKTYRNFSLAHFDVAHLTAGAIDTALTTPGQEIMDLPIPELAQLAGDYASLVLPTHGDYSKIVAAALHIAKATGAIEDISILRAEMPSIPDAEATEVALLAVSLIQARTEIFGSSGK